MYIVEIEYNGEKRNLEFKKSPTLIDIADKIYDGFTGEFKIIAITIPSKKD